jgi:replicative DNA helicase
MQQNIESSSKDRRKADMSEPGLNDLKDSGSPSQDADIVLQLFFPFREKLKTYRGFKVLDDDGIGQALRSVIISKNRYGIANQVICLGF